MWLVLESDQRVNKMFKTYCMEVKKIVSYSETYIKCMLLATVNHYT